MSLVKSDESHARRLANCRDSFSRKRFSMAFSSPSRLASSRPRCPDLEHLRGALSDEDHRAAFEGRREGNQAAGISDISGFAAPRLAGRAAQLLRTFFPLIAAKLSYAGTWAPRVRGMIGAAPRRALNAKSGR